jgi:hypothetical protein
VAGVGDLRGRVSRARGLTRHGGRGAREGGEGQGGGRADQETGTDPTGSAGSRTADQEAGGSLFWGVRQYSVRGRHERRLSISSSATAYRVS